MISRSPRACQHRAFSKNTVTVFFVCFSLLALPICKPPSLAFPTLLRLSNPFPIVCHYQCFRNGLTSHSCLWRIMTSPAELRQGHREAGSWQSNDFSQAWPATDILYSVLLKTSSEHIHFLRSDAWRLFPFSSSPWGCTRSQVSCFRFKQLEEKKQPTADQPGCFGREISFLGLLSERISDAGRR